MAKRSKKWDVSEDGQLTCNFADTNDKVTFDIAKIFKDFEKMSEVQKYLVSYGVKQNLADDVAGVTEIKPMITGMEARFNELLNGTIRSKKTGATGLGISKKELQSNIDKMKENDPKQYKKAMELLKTLGLKI